MEKTALTDSANKYPAELSGGMEKRAALARAIVLDPEILFLDEPTTGVDAVSRKEFWEMLKRLKEQGITILVSTPYMDEATLCERIALIQGGKILSVDTPAAITQTYPEKLYAIKASQMSRLITDLRSNENINSCNAFGEYHHITFRTATNNATTALTSYLQSKHYDHIELKEIRPTVEDCFIKLMNN